MEPRHQELEDDELVDVETRDQDERDGAAPHDADRPPTPDEEAAAERGARDVDPDAGEHFEEMAKLGANARGEGRVE